MIMITMNEPTPRKSPCTWSGNKICTLLLYIYIYMWITLSYLTYTMLENCNWIRAYNYYINNSKRIIWIIMLNCLEAGHLWASFSLSISSIFKHLQWCGLPVCIHVFQAKSNILYWMKGIQLRNINTLSLCIHK